ncbi:MAG: HAD family hydrolase [Verrucomicrobia bacterium]|nr:HAD family hydrolase [Verrucomicrobiota bacterium]
MNKPSLPDLVLWDMDGTLIDQTDSIIRCYHEVIQSFGFSKPSPLDIKRSLGGPLTHTLSLFLPEDSIDAARILFKETFPKYMFEGMVVLEGAMELIKRLNEQGIPQAIITNKQGGNARAVSKKCGFDQYIKVCVGNGDNPYEKPQVEFTESVIQALGGEYNHIVLIGDSPTDVETALNYKANCFAVTTGSHNKDELIAGAEKAFDNLNELIELWAL